HPHLQWWHGPTTELRAMASFVERAFRTYSAHIRSRSADQEKPIFSAKLYTPEKPALPTVPEGDTSHRSRSARARAVSARFLAAPRSLPLMRLPVASRDGPSMGGNRPKFTFMGWNERGPTSLSTDRWPPVIWARSAPNAVVGGGGLQSRPSRSA